MKLAALRANLDYGRILRNLKASDSYPASGGHHFALLPCFKGVIVD
jgi:hypothetical protein